MANVWSDGLVTGEHRDADGQTFEFSQMNGGELRSYGDGRMQFISADGQSTWVPLSDPNFSWSSVPGYDQSFGSGLSGGGDTGGNTGGDQTGSWDGSFDWGSLGWGGDVAIDYGNSGWDSYSTDTSSSGDGGGGGDWVAPDWTDTSSDWNWGSSSWSYGWESSYHDYSSYFDQLTYWAPDELPFCFTADTPVLMADGAERAIADIRDGDTVLAFDGAGALVPARVIRTLVHDDVAVEPWVTADGRRFAASPGHRVLAAEGGFKCLSQLAPGEAVLDAAGRPVGLSRDQGVPWRARVHNLTVEGLHTYVAAGVRVHNMKPIVVDLSGNNRIELVGLDESGVLFDMDGDGFKEHTAWVGPHDGLLAYDIGGDGKITDPREIVFALYAGRSGATDLEGLAAGFDANHDGVLDSRDTGYGMFGIWRDANQNGVTDPSEFHSLADLGVVFIDLGSTGPPVESNGNTILGTTTLTRADGSTALVGDVDLAAAEAWPSWASSPSASPPPARRWRITATPSLAPPLSPAPPWRREAPCACSTPPPSDMAAAILTAT